MGSSMEVETTLIEAEPSSIEVEMVVVDLASFWSACSCQGGACLGRCVKALEVGALISSSPIQGSSLLLRWRWDWLWCDAAT